MRHFIPLDVKAEKKFSPKIFVFDFFFIIGFVVIGATLQGIVVPPFRVLFLVFNALLGLYLSRPSRNNPGKRVFQSYWIYLCRPRTTYHPVTVEPIKIRGRKS